MTELPETFIGGVTHCARCGEDHPKGSLTYKRFQRPVVDEDGTIWNYWATCPTNGDPILGRTTPDQLPEKPTHQEVIDQNLANLTSKPLSFEQVLATMSEQQRNDLITGNFIGQFDYTPKPIIPARHLKMPELPPDTMPLIRYEPSPNNSSLISGEFWKAWDALPEEPKSEDAD